MTRRVVGRHVLRGRSGRELRARFGVRAGAKVAVKAAVRGVAKGAGADGGMGGMDRDALVRRRVRLG